MGSEPESGKKLAGWAEHTVVANFPRVLPRAVYGSDGATEHPALSQTEEPLTVIGEPPSQATARALLARYAALNDTAPGVTAEVAPEQPSPSEEPMRVPLRTSLIERIVDFARDDFQRAPRIVRLLVPALPLVAVATTILDADPRPSSSAPAAAATARNASSASMTSEAPPAQAHPPRLPLPAMEPATAAALPNKGRTLQAEAADAAARRDRPRAIALYSELARQHPDEPAYASATRILMRDEARERPRVP
jgi:hypothetical protein